MRVELYNLRPEGCRNIANKGTKHICHRYDDTGSRIHNNRKNDVDKVRNALKVDIRAQARKHIKSRKGQHWLKNVLIKRKTKTTLLKMPYAIDTIDDRNKNIYKQ